MLLCTLTILKTDSFRFTSLVSKQLSQTFVKNKPQDPPIPEQQNSITRKATFGIIAVIVLPYFKRKRTPFLKHVPRSPR